MHAEKSFRNHVNPNKIWIEISFFRLIYHIMEFRSVLHQSGMCIYNTNLVCISKIAKDISRAWVSGHVGTGWAELLMCPVTGKFLLYGGTSSEPPHKPSYIPSLLRSPPSFSCLPPIPSSSFLPSFTLPRLTFLLLPAPFPPSLPDVP